MSKLINENNIDKQLTALSGALNESECIQCAYSVVNTCIDILIHKVFNKDDHAVKYVVAPLLSQDGPLADIVTRCRLLLGLGVIDKQNYDDIEIIITLYRWDELNIEAMSFDDNNVLFELNRISLIKQSMPIEPLSSLLDSYQEDMDDQSRALLSQRHFFKIRSSLSLAIAQLVEDILQDNPLIS